MIILVVIGIGAFPILLYLAGFTAAGVAAGSIAAWIQSYFYGAVTCGIFSYLQWLGAIGFGTLGQFLLYCYTCIVTALGISKLNRKGGL